MQAKVWLADSRKKLEKAGIGTARLDALVLLEDVAGKDRAWLLANPDHELSPSEQVKLTKLLNERAKHTPLAYIRGTTEFYGRDFVITPSVLVPRPESETMIDLLGQLSATGKLTLKSGKNGGDSRKTLKIADVGAGSGALGITAKLEFPKDQKVDVDLLEIDPGALKIAELNVEKYTTTISVIKSDLLERSAKDYDLLLCNLPYVPDGHTVNKAASREPKLAIFGGPDGLGIYRRLFEQVKELKKQPLYILTESLPLQHSGLKKVAEGTGYTLITTDGFIQVFALKDI